MDSVREFAKHWDYIVISDMKLSKDPGRIRSDVR